MAGDPTGSLIVSIPKLNTHNYQDWKFAVQMVMRHTGCYGVATGTEERLTTREKQERWDLQAENAFTIIGLSIKPDQYEYIWDAKTGPAAWAALRAIYEKNSRANRIALKREFYITRHDLNAPIHEYTNRIMALANRLKAIGVTLKDKDIVDVLIFNLDPSWASIASSLSALPGDLKLADVISTLVDEEARRAPETAIPGPTEDTALYTRSRRFRAANAPQCVKCYICGKPGHISHNCPKRQDQAHVTNDSNSDPDINLLATGTIW
ncbi:hypothetical protein BN946_scf184802.g2 [Trametes cinnabarina]|uniref:CCHC-type domain-containing protein n=1 Tax=Pycnoporus cinnabarinus TaxID=5643 RepID=A0A060SQ39_PYCCI|nr:hypothetical protein BN946_scf184802.g2 [Trametes cinnabarina]